MTKLTHQDGNFFNYEHLVTGEVKTIRENGATSGGGVLATFTYDDLGRRLLLMRGNGARTDYAHDPVSRLEALGQTFPGSPSQGVTASFTYNKASQIKTATRDNDMYAFTAVPSGNVPSSVNGQNQLLTHNGVNITYDARGNLSNDRGSSPGQAPRSYGYTSENRLAISGNVSLTYDPVRRLLVSDTGTSNTRFDHLGDEMILELNSANAIQKRFVHGPGVDEPLVQYEGPALDSATRRFLHADERGSILAMSDSAGNVVGVNRYDEYGKPEGPTGAGTLLGRFGYTGQAWLPELGALLLQGSDVRPREGPVPAAGSDRVRGRNEPLRLCRQRSGELHRSDGAAGRRGPGRHRNRDEAAEVSRGLPARRLRRPVGLVRSQRSEWRRRR
jgi:hypothetical protein